MSFKVFTQILRNALIKRKRNVILPNYPNQLLVCFSLKKKLYFGRSVYSIKITFILKQFFLSKTTLKGVPKMH